MPSQQMSAGRVPQGGHICPALTAQTVRPRLSPHEELRQQCRKQPAKEPSRAIIPWSILRAFSLSKAEPGREDMQGNQIGRTDAVALARMIRKKQVSAKEVTEAVLARMEKIEPHIHAFCTPTPDVARKAAAKI